MPWGYSRASSRLARGVEMQAVSRETIKFIPFLYRLFPIIQCSMPRENLRCERKKQGMPSSFTNSASSFRCSRPQARSLMQHSSLLNPTHRKPRRRHTPVDSNAASVPPLPTEWSPCSGPSGPHPLHSMSLSLLSPSWSWGEGGGTKTFAPKAAKTTTHPPPILVNKRAVVYLRLTAHRHLLSLVHHLIP